MHIEPKETNKPKNAEIGEDRERFEIPNGDNLLPQRQKSEEASVLSNDKKKTIICSRGRGCANYFQEYCLVKGWKPYDRHPTKCDDYHERRGI